MSTPKLILKEDLDAELASLMGIPKREAAAFSALFLNAARKALVEHGTLRLDGLGTLRVYTSRGRRAATAELTSYVGKKTTVLVEAKRFVAFKKSVRLRDELRAHFAAAEAKKEKTNGQVRRERTSRRKSGKEGK